MTNNVAANLPHRSLNALFLAFTCLYLAGCASKPPDQVITAVAAGASHTVLLKGDGSVWQCGLSQYSYRGAGIEFEQTTPVRVDTGFIKIAAGPQYSLALKADGSLWGWGEDQQGRTVGRNALRRMHSPLLARSACDLLRQASGGLQSALRS